MKYIIWGIVASSFVSLFSLLLENYQIKFYEFVLISLVSSLVFKNTEE